MNIWIHDDNFRVYKDDDGNETVGPNYRLSWREQEIVDETSRSYITRSGRKISKKEKPYDVEYSYENVLKRVYQHDHQYKISQAVQRADCDTLVKVAKLIGYEPIVDTLNA